MAEGESKPPVKEPSVMGQLAHAATGGFEFLLTILLPGALGYWLDGKWQTRPWLMLAGGLFGFGVGLYMMLRSAKQGSR